MPVGAPGTNYYFGGVTVENLRQLLQEKLDWVMETRGATRVSVTLTGEQLDAILSRLDQPAPDLPKIEPRLLLTDEDIERQYEDGICLGAGLPRETCPCGFCQKYREPRLLHPQEPRGTKRSPEEVAQRLAELYGQSEELRGKFLRTCA